MIGKRSQNQDNWQLLIHLNEEEVALKKKVRNFGYEVLCEFVELQINLGRMKQIPRILNSFLLYHLKQKGTKKK
jgi:hypothetical protein